MWWIAVQLPAILKAPTPARPHAPTETTFLFASEVWQGIDATGSLIAAMVALVGVIWGFRVWRHQVRAARQRDVAEGLLVAALAARNALEVIRQKCLLPSDVAATHAEAATRVLDQLDRRSDVVSQLKAAQHLAFVCLSPGVAGAADRLLSLFGKVRGAAAILAGPAPPSDPAEMRQLVETIEASFTDQVAPEIESAVRAIIDASDPYLRMA
jgi:hypothetical protein